MTWVVGLWLVLAGLAVILEMLTLSIILLMFAGGAVAAAIVAGVGGGPVAQILTFGIVSVLMLYFVRPGLVRHWRSTTLTSGTDALIGAGGYAESQVGARDGRVKIAGEVWSARSHDGGDIPADAEITVVAIDGATAVVAPSRSDA